jgi:hypothetical protein
MKDYVIPVNPFEERKEAYSSIGGMREHVETSSGRWLYRHFSCGEVSNKNNEIGEVLDKEWELALKLIKKLKFLWFLCIFMLKILIFYNVERFIQICKL